MAESESAVRPLITFHFSSLVLRRLSQCREKPVCRRGGGIHTINELQTLSESCFVPLKHRLPPATATLPSHPTHVGVQIAGQRALDDFFPRCLGSCTES